VTPASFSTTNLVAKFASSLFFHTSFAALSASRFAHSCASAVLRGSCAAALRPSAALDCAAR
jgi:hypothetical protein